MAGRPQASQVTVRTDGSCQGRAYRFCETWRWRERFPNGYCRTVRVLCIGGGGANVPRQTYWALQPGKQLSTAVEGESQGIDAERRATPTKWLPRTRHLFNAMLQKCWAIDTKIEKRVFDFEASWRLRNLRAGKFHIYIALRAKRRRWRQAFKNKNVWINLEVNICDKDCTEFPVTGSKLTIWKLSTVGPRYNGLRM
jgi:hypothetical protein